ncbi:MAG: glyceraldehyde-3-phosphate dehydrogenase 1 [Benjaminiella poitrasii]|nr:MAG: glyceraldehyde-3-phosphate dehydrogenase 1 [Benjaminiella poitrasii]
MFLCSIVYFFHLKTKVAAQVGINGFDRIGSMALFASIKNPKIQVVAINEPFISLDNMPYLLEHNTVYGRFKGTVEAREGKLVFNGKDIDSNSGAEYIIEFTKVFTTVKAASRHLKGGAKKVIISAPSPSAPTFIYGVNQNAYKPDYNVVSSGSCITNCRATSGNIILSSTDVTKGVGKVILASMGKLNDMAFCVPTLCVFIVKFNVNLAKPTSHDDIKTAASSVFDVTAGAQLTLSSARTIFLYYNKSSYSSRVFDNITNMLRSG